MKLVKTIPSIMIVDDDPAILKTLEVVFEDFEANVQLFSDVDDFQKSFHENTTHPSLIICDYQMPKLNGLELLSLVKANHHEIPVILITGNGSDELGVAALEAGAYDYVTKPLNLKELFILSKRAINQFQLKRNVKVLERRLNVLESTNSNFIGQSKEIENIRKMIKKVASTNASILVTGETGTGKEVVAKLLHEVSDRKKEKFISVNCASIPEQLLESELFGHKKGAFTGAVDNKVGLFSEANKGTIFLDEIGDMPIALQAKLLRVIQDGKFRRVGENTETQVDVRIIAATHKNLLEAIQNGQFREDLFYRINVINIHLPSLKERREDIALLCSFFLKELRKKNKIKAKVIAKDALEKLMRYSWPGNVRELQNVIERAGILCTNEVIDQEDILLKSEIIDGDQNSTFENLYSLDQLEKEYIDYVLNHTGFVKEKTAQILGINRKTLYRKIKEYGLERNED